MIVPKQDSHSNNRMEAFICNVLQNTVYFLSICIIY